MVNACLFCGGDASAADHLLHCDGRQGHQEAVTFDPLLVAGATADTYATSEAAAVSVEDKKDTQRLAVFQAIRAAGPRGRTDDELQVILGLDGSSERPRRWELWKRQAIKVQLDADGQAVRRLTRTNRHAVVWVVNG